MGIFKFLTAIESLSCKQFYETNEFNVLHEMLLYILFLLVQAY